MNPEAVFAALEYVFFIIYQYLNDNDTDLHIVRIKKAYGEQLRTMAESINEYFPSERLNFSCTGEEVIRDGIARLGKAIEMVLSTKS